MISIVHKGNIVDCRRKSSQPYALFLFSLVYLFFFAEEEVKISDDELGQIL